MNCKDIRMLYENLVNINVIHEPPYESKSIYYYFIKNYIYKDTILIYFIIM